MVENQKKEWRGVTFFIKNGTNRKRNFMDNMIKVIKFNVSLFCGFCFVCTTRCSICNNIHVAGLEVLSEHPTPTFNFLGDPPIYIKFW